MKITHRNKPKEFVPKNVFALCTDLDEPSCSDGPEDLVDGGVGGQSAVEDVELPLEALGDVVTTASWVDHGSDDGDVHQTGELSGLLQVVEALVLHHLAGDLVGHLARSNENFWISLDPSSMC
jgi:hypothetical protein